jgi:hypothetical protein
MGVGAAIAAGGLIWFLVDGRRTERVPRTAGTRFHVAPLGTSGAALGLHGTF